VSDVGNFSFDCAYNYHNGRCSWRGESVLVFQIVFFLKVRKAVCWLFLTLFHEQFNLKFCCNEFSSQRCFWLQQFGFVFYELPLLFQWLDFMGKVYVLLIRELRKTIKT
jgi:hypothetical protein